MENKAISEIIQIPLWILESQIVGREGLRPVSWPQPSERTVDLICIAQTSLKSHLIS